MAMKIENWTGTVDTFTWTHNPQSYDDSAESNHTNQQIGYQSHHIVTSGGGILPREIILTGHMDGASKRTHMENMTKHFFETTKIKKLYFQSGKFAVGIGRGVKETDVGGRTNFIDYVARFETMLGILLGNTPKTSGTNEGNITTFVTSITGRHDGAGDVTITDGEGNQITIPEAAFAGKTYFKYNLVKMVDSGSGVYVSEYGYFEVCATLGGTYTEVSTVQVTTGFGVLKIARAANMTTITFTNVTGTPTVTFRDGWSF